MLRKSHGLDDKSSKLWDLVHFWYWQVVLIEENLYLVVFIGAKCLGI